MTFPSSVCGDRRPAAPVCGTGRRPARQGPPARLRSDHRRDRHRGFAAVRSGPAVPSLLHKPGLARAGYAAELRHGPPPTVAVGQ